MEYYLYGSNIEKNSKYSIRPPSLTINPVTSTSRPFRLEICLPRICAVYRIRGPEYNSPLLLRAPGATLWREIRPPANAHQRSLWAASICALRPDPVSTRDDLGPDLVRILGVRLWEYWNARLPRDGSGAHILTTLNYRSHPLLLTPRQR